MNRDTQRERFDRYAWCAQSPWISQVISRTRVRDKRDPSALCERRSSGAQPWNKANVYVCVCLGVFLYACAPSQHGWMQLPRSAANQSTNRLYYDWAKKTKTAHCWMRIVCVCISQNMIQIRNDTWLHTRLCVCARYYQHNTQFSRERHAHTSFQSRVVRCYAMHIPTAKSHPFAGV